MLKASRSTPNIPAAATVSAVDRALCARALVGGGRMAAENDDPLTNKSKSNTSSAGKDNKSMSRELLKDTIRAKKHELRREQDRLSSSLTTALCKGEEALLQDKKWMEQIKDLNNSFEKIPPITTSNKVKSGSKARSYYVDFN